MTGTTQDSDTAKTAAAHRQQAARHRAEAVLSLAGAEEETSLALKAEVDGGLRDRSTVEAYPSDIDGALRYRER